MAVTQRQVKMYMNYRSKGLQQSAASAKAGLSERTGRRIEKQEHRGARSVPRPYKTRKDPLNGIFEQELRPLLVAEPALEPLTLFEYLEEHYPGQYGASILRTLQRRVKHWRVKEGPTQEVMFAQRHPPGEWGLSDFTQLPLGLVTIHGVPFQHRLYHFHLLYSRQIFVRVVMGGESYTALSESLQMALQAMGGSPRQHRTDRLTAAYKNLSSEAIEDLTVRYDAFCAHYGMRPTRNNLGCPHENGGIEGMHAHLKRWICQGLKLRGCGDFDSLEAYEAWLKGLILRKNNRHQIKALEEKACLQPLPDGYACDYTELSARVSCYSAIQVKLVTYTVPSRLKGCQVVVHLYDRLIKIFYGNQCIIELPRKYPSGDKRRARQIDYRHVIHSLVKKPMAFGDSVWQEDLLPSPSFKQLWSICQAHYPLRKACSWMVGVLALAASQANDNEFGDQLLAHYAQAGSLPELALLQKQYKIDTPPTATIHCEQHALASYNELLRMGGVY